MVIIYNESIKVQKHFIPVDKSFKIEDFMSIARITILLGG